VNTTDQGIRYHCDKARSDVLTLLLPQVRMLTSFLDHLVITAPSLAEGTRYIRQALGVSLEVGGAHPGMGTHNCLLCLGNGRYLEVLAIDPRAPSPARPRWFDLDRGTHSSGPRIAGWVARVGDIDEASAAAPEVFGPPEGMRRGTLEWRITIPADGGLPFQGVAPMLIQWAAGGHPANHLQDRGCSLVRLEGFHPQADRINALLRTIGFQEGWAVSQRQTPGLIAHFRTPAGERLLNRFGDPHG
jgi:hypothetical protein